MTVMGFPSELFLHSLFRGGGNRAVRPLKDALRNDTRVVKEILSLLSLHGQMSKAEHVIHCASREHCQGAAHLQIVSDYQGRNVVRENEVKEPFDIQSGGFAFVI